MAQPLRNPDPETRSYAERIRELVEQERVPAARKLLAEALEHGEPIENLGGWPRVLAPAKVIKVGGERDIDRGPDFQWLSDHGGEYRNRWVAICRGELLAEDPSLKGLLEKLKDHPSGSKALLQRIY